MPEMPTDDNPGGETADNSVMAGDNSSPDMIEQPGEPAGKSSPAGAKPARGGKPLIVRLERSIGMVMPANKVRKFLGSGAIPPVSERKHFVARLKHLDRIDVIVVEGDNESADKNVIVGEVGLTNIKLREDGRAEIEIDFTLDDKGMLIVTLIDRLTKTDCFARFVLPQFSSEKIDDAEISQVPVSELSQKIDLLEQQMKLLKGELSVRRERDKDPS